MELPKLIKKIEKLYRIRDKLLRLPKAETGIWISEYTVSKTYPGSKITHYYTYAKWESIEPIFKCNPKPKLKNKGKAKTEFTRHKYIGRVRSSTDLPMDDAVKIAYSKLRNRRRLERVEKTIKNIESALENF